MATTLTLLLSLSGIQCPTGAELGKVSPGGLGRWARLCCRSPCASPIPVPLLWPQLRELVLPGALASAAPGPSQSSLCTWGTSSALQLILKASKSVPFSLISATSLFPLLKYFGKQSMFGLGARGKFESSFGCQALVGSWALGLCCGPHWGQVEGPFFSTQTPFEELLRSTKGWLDELAQAGLVAPALRARGPRMFAWAPGAVS